MVERHFYKLHPLADSDIVYLEFFISRLEPPSMRPFYQKLLKSFALIANIHEIIRDKNAVPHDEKEKIKKSLIEFEDDLHDKIEIAAAPFLDKLRQKQSGFINSDESAVNFLLYLCQQYFRTKSMRISIKNELSRQSHFLGSANATNFLCFIVAYSFGFSFFVEKKEIEIVFLENKSLSFITGDQPVINLLANRFGGSTTETILYYPLTPHLSCLLTHKTRNLLSKHIPEKIVNKLNGLISWHSHHFIVGDSDNAIRAAIRNQPTRNQTVMDVLESLSANP